jgi:HK97 gp10 family phage protein
MPMSDYVEGADELIAKLQSLATKDAKAAIRKGTRQAAKSIQTVAQRLAPIRTGTLSRGIKVRSLPRSRIWTGTRVTLMDVPYGSFEELGAPGKDIAAQHFMKRAAQQQGARALDQAIEIIKQTIEEEMSD